MHHKNILWRQMLVDQVLAEFSKGPFKWGERDCGKMLIWHLRNAGYMIAADGTWTNERGLLRWLKRNGGSGGACLTGWGLQSKPPAFALPADICEIDGCDSPTGAFGVVLGNGRVIAYHESVESLAVIQPKALKAVWSV